MSRPSLVRLAGTFFGVGYFPKAPGTAGSVAAAAIFAGIHLVLPPGSAAVVHAVLLAAVVLACSWAALNVKNAFGGRKDPPEFVLDEVAGQLLALTGMTNFSDQSDLLIFTVAGLILFRVFDIVKPGVISRIDQADGPFGILMDDLAAGAAGCLILNLAFLMF